MCDAPARRAGGSVLWKGVWAFTPWARGESNFPCVPVASRRRPAVRRPTVRRRRRRCCCCIAPLKSTSVALPTGTNTRYLPACLPVVSTLCRLALRFASPKLTVRGLNVYVRLDEGDPLLDERAQLVPGEVHAVEVGQDVEALHVLAAQFDFPERLVLVLVQVRKINLKDPSLEPIRSDLRALGSCDEGLAARPRREHVRCLHGVPFLLEERVDGLLLAALLRLCQSLVLACRGEGKEKTDVCELHARPDKCFVFRAQWGRSGWESGKGRKGLQQPSEQPAAGAAVARECLPGTCCAQGSSGIHSPIAMTERLSHNRSPRSC
jgi:hypothetical protein